jgi:hypothetical protein
VARSQRKCKMSHSNLKTAFHWNLCIEGVCRMWSEPDSGSCDSARISAVIRGMLVEEKNVRCQLDCRL